MGKGARSRQRPDIESVGSEISGQIRRPSELAPGRWPEIRIARRVDLDCVDGEELREQWNGFINNLAARNYGKGNGVALGSSALTLVSAQEFGRMLERKYSRAYEDRQRTVRLHRRFADGYNEFIRKDGRDRIDAQLDRFDNAHARSMEPDFGDDDEIILTAVGTNSDSLLWGAGRFFVRSLRGYGKDVFGADLNGNDLLHEEWAETVAYLRSEQLDTNLMNRHPETGRLYHDPHIRLFETLGHVSSVALNYSMDVPHAIDLAAPRALSFK